MNPHCWFPQARAITKRRIIAHLGPTNSGKTHGAIQALLKAPSGSYCGPLRLLAQEQYEKCKSAVNPNGENQVRMSLRTGELVASWNGSVEESTIAIKDWRLDGATHLACTVEMADLANKTHTSVLDEVQLMADEGRGWAFTQCLLGVPSEDVYVCGEEAILPLLEQICESMKNELVVKRFDRLGPLQLIDPVSIKSLQPGDAIIAFSRFDIFRLKRLVEHKLNMPNSCAVVYGGLPLEHRLAQAAAFNSGKVPFLIASDAIGLGLNLNIGRILFTTFQKYSRDADGLISADSRLVKQIGGRAGRFGGEFAKEGGKVGVLQVHEDDENSEEQIGKKFVTQLDLQLKQLWSKPVTPYKHAGILAPDHILLGLCDQKATRLKEAFDKSVSLPLPAPFYSHSLITSFQNTLEAISMHLPKLDAASALLLAKAPVRHPRPASLIMIETMAAHLASCQPPARYVFPRLGNLYLRAPMMKPREERLGEAEEVYRALELYKWVSLRFPHAFPLAAQSERFGEEQRLVDKFIRDNLR